MAKKWKPDWLRWVAGIGVLHYNIAFLMWCFTLTFIIKTDRKELTENAWVYFVLRFVPCTLMLAAFIIAVALVKRKRRFTKWLLASLAAISIAWFAFDAYRQDYQEQIMTSDKGCYHVYTTWWWWYDDSWDRNR